MGEQILTKFIHTSDWQIGRAFSGFPDDVRGILVNARFETIRRIGQEAMTKGSRLVVVAGDVYDLEEPSTLTLRKPLEIMRSFPDVDWALMPGNHDPARTDGLWDRLSKSGLPSNVHLMLDNAPVLLKDKIAVLPAPLRRKRSTGDMTDWMKGAETPDGYLRIGVAHGPVVGFGSDDDMVNNLVPPDRAEQSHLDYLALGDWHSTMRVGPRTWYSGTHETDRYKARDGEEVSGGGKILSVTLEGPGAFPEIEAVHVGEFTWRQIERTILEDEAIENIVKDLEDISSPQKNIVRLGLKGALSLAGMAALDSKVQSRFGATFGHFEAETSGLLPEPTDDDISSIDSSGFVRSAAERLRGMIKSPDQQVSRLARLALTRLYVETAGA